MFIIKNKKKSNIIVSIVSLPVLCICYLTFVNKRAFVSRGDHEIKEYLFRNKNQSETKKQTIFVKHNSNEEEINVFIILCKTLAGPQIKFVRSTYYP